jgi:hypothetical protein
MHLTPPSRASVTSSSHPSKIRMDHKWPQLMRRPGADEPPPIPGPREKLCWPKVDTKSSARTRHNPGLRSPTAIQKWTPGGATKHEPAAGAADSPPSKMSKGDSGIGADSRASPSQAVLEIQLS